MDQLKEQRRSADSASNGFASAISSTNAAENPTIPSSVSKQLALLVDHQNTNTNNNNIGSKRMPPEAAEAVSEALRLIVREAHRRASIEVSGSMGTRAIVPFASQHSLKERNLPAFISSHRYRRRGSSYQGFRLEI